MFLTMLQAATITITATVLPQVKADASTMTVQTNKGTSPPTQFVDAGPFAPLRDVMLASNAKVSIPKQDLPEQSRPPMVFVVRFD